jgi:hypothetical protein
MPEPMKPLMDWDFVRVAPNFLANREVSSDARNTYIRHVSHERENPKPQVTVGLSRKIVSWTAPAQWQEPTISCSQLSRASIEEVEEYIAVLQWAVQEAKEAKRAAAD